MPPRRTPGPCCRMSQPPVRTNAFKVLVGNLAKLEGGVAAETMPRPASRVRFGLGSGMPTIGGELLRVGDVGK